MGQSKRRCPPGTPCFICYQPITEAQEYSKGHVLPRCFFPSQFRNQPGINFPTLWAHKDCDGSFSLDEDYLRHSLGPLSFGSPIGDLMHADLRAAAARPETRPLFERVRAEFGRVIETGTGMMTKEVDGARFKRVFTKAFRGLIATQVEFRNWVPLDAPVRVLMETRPQLGEFEQGIIRAFLETDPLWPQLQSVTDIRWVDGLPRGHIFMIVLWSRILVIGTIETMESERLRDAAAQCGEPGPVWSVQPF